MRRLAIIVLLATSFSFAQFGGYSSPQAVIKNIFNGSISAPQASSDILNMGQTTHLIIYTTTGPGPVRVRMEFSYDGTTWAPMSPDDTDVPGTGTPSAIFATGTFPHFRLNVLLLGSAGNTTLLAFYSATSATTLASTSLFNASQQYKQLIGYQQAENASFTATIPVPFGAAGGTVWFLFNGVPGSAADLLQASCGPDLNSADQLQVFSQTLNQTSGLRTFLIGSVPCSTVTITYTPGAGAIAGTTWSAWYQFTAPNIPSKVIAGGGSNPSQLAEPDFDCAQSAAIAISLGAGGTTQIIAGSGNEIVHLCHISFACSAAQSVKLQQGTGTNCGTGTADLTGVYPVQTNFQLNLAPNNSLRANPGQAMCVNVAAAATCGGLATYARY